MVAGWDFSQYFGDGFMSVDGGSTFTNVLSANYSDLDPTFGAGFESQAFGTMFVNGSFGSTNVAAGSGTEEFVPSATAPGSLVSNLGAPATVDFDAFTVLADEGQVSTELLAMLATAPAVVVFEVDLGPAGQTGSNWSLGLGAKTTSGTSSVGVEFSTDGLSFTPLGSLQVSAVDGLFRVALGSASSAQAFVRLSFAPSATDRPFIDNVAISAELAGGATPTPTPTGAPTPTPTAGPTPTATAGPTPTPTATGTATGTPSATPTPTTTP